ncbi:MAG: hypothetical protein LBR12_03650 [Opitutaceae bacterium]|jgi:hypothetical protein|nr:hypothetical protein [Opitutaceae bacterium]
MNAIAEFAVFFCAGTLAALPAFFRKAAVSAPAFVPLPKGLFGLALALWSLRFLTETARGPGGAAAIVSVAVALLGGAIGAVFVHKGLHKHLISLHGEAGPVSARLIGKTQSFQERAGVALAVLSLAGMLLAAV